MSDDLVRAAFDGDVEAVARLLDEGADIEAGGGLWNPLHAAIENEQTECVRLLVRRGADVHRCAGDLSPLVHAVDIAIDGTWQRSHALGGEPTDIIEMLLEAGADPAPGLQMAQRYGSEKIIGLLTRSRPDQTMSEHAAMTFSIYSGNGDSADAPTPDVMRRFLEALDPQDEEHGAAWVSDEHGNSLEYEVGGNLAFSQSTCVRHLPKVSLDRVVELWQKLAAGRLDELEREPWQPGARPPLSPEAREARNRMLAEAQLASDRRFYEALGSERAANPCRADGCVRGSVAFSVFCRQHHFENVMKRPCPFERESG